jgi:tetratricopeptide (TPR) repeat protein
METQPRLNFWIAWIAVVLRLKMTQGSRIKALFVVGTYKKILHKALDLDPNNLDAREEEIGFLFQAPGIAGGDKKKTKERIEDLKALDLPKTMYFEAIFLRDEEKNEESIAILEALLEENPDDADAHQTLAFWLQADKKFQEANEHFAVLKGSDDRRRSLSAQYQLARSRVLGEFDQEKAVELLLDYLQQSPEKVQGVRHFPMPIGVWELRTSSSVRSRRRGRPIPRPSPWTATTRKPGRPSRTCPEVE